MLQSAVGKRLEAEDRLDWTAFYMDEFQRHERVQERGDGMRLIIDISEYNVEYIKNAYGIPQDINMIIAEAIINGKQIPTPHGRLIDIKSVEEGKFVKVSNGFQRWWNDALESVIDNASTVIEAED